MEALTNTEKATVYYSDESTDKSVIEPMTNYFLSRFQQDFKEGTTTVGGILTAVNRNLKDTPLNYLHKSAYTGGIDVSHEFAKRQSELLASVAFSKVNGDTTAIQRTQKSSARYFQARRRRPSDL
jgi:hypothetical protein